MTVREEKGEGGGVFRVWREDESKQGDGSGVRGAKEQIKRKIIYNLEMNIVIFLIFITSNNSYWNCNFPLKVPCSFLGTCLLTLTNIYLRNF